MIDPRVASGLRDLPPSVMIPRERMLAIFRQTFAGFGFVPIETPHIERMEVLTGKGAGSEEVLRQIFEVTNKGGTPGELALRFDLTVPLARFVAKHIDTLGVPFKRYAIGSVFRGERPAKGRFREFMQCDFDTIGTESAVADAEIAQVIHAALDGAGVPDFTITLNNRKILDGFLDAQGLTGRSGPVLRALDKLAKIGREAVLEELAKAGETDGSGPSVDQAKHVLDFAESGRGGVDVLNHVEAALGSNAAVAAGIGNLRTVLSLLSAAGVPESRLTLDLGLARGLDYYTGVVFETTVIGWEKFGSVASGGRYDNLASLFTPRRLPGVGASIGLDRLLALLDEAGWLKSAATTVPVLIANFSGIDPVIPFTMASRLRKAGIGVEVFPDQIPIGKQMGYGSTRGHKLAVIVGPDEAAKQVFNLRNLLNRQEDKGLAWSVLEDSVESALQIVKQQEGGTEWSAGVSDPKRPEATPVAERPVGLVRGTRSWLPSDFARLAAIERRLVDGFAQAGYQAMRTPILEFTDLHERKSGAGIVSKLFELVGAGSAAICLRPELTASIVRAYAEAAECPALPWRVSSSGPVFRYESSPGAGRLREFTQVGVELIGAPGPAADAEVIGLADLSLANTGIGDVTIRIGHVGLILEILGHAGLPRSASSALVEMLSAAAADGKGIQTIESALERLSGWLESGGEAEAIVPAVSHADDPGVDRLFRHLVPNVTGRRSGHEIINRLRGKWELDRTLSQILERVREQFHGLAELRGPAPEVLERLGQSFAGLAPRSIADLGALIKELAHHGVEGSRVELDLGFGRGIGFYSQMIFELVVETAAGPVEVCGGGRYDGLARVLGSDRDDRGVGFAFGLERLMEVCLARVTRPNQPQQAL